MKTLPWLISVSVHGLILLLGGLTFEQAVVGIAPGRNSIEVNLVAAPSEPTVQPSLDEPSIPPIEPPLPEVEIPRPLVTFTPAPVPTPDMVPMPATAQSQPSPSHKVTNHNKLSRDTGKDAVTEQVVGGAIVDEDPDYLSNPPPVYPEDARSAGQEGVVTLDVIVGTDGRPETIKIISSSGYYLLDDSAKSAVQHYKFRPATVGGIKCRSHVKVPVCFRLDG
jgi:periplasmic protein TonB